jgi:hypothetical protein
MSALPLTVTFTVTDEEVNLLLAGLGKLPAEASFNLLARLVQIVQAETRRREGLAREAEAANEARAKQRVNAEVDQGQG